MCRCRGCLGGGSARFGGIGGLRVGGEAILELVVGCRQECERIAGSVDIVEMEDCLVSVPVHSSPLSWPCICYRFPARKSEGGGGRIGIPEV